VGEELNELCRRGLGLGRFLPLEHAVELIRQGAAGMGYFHAKRGSEGSAFAGVGLDIVHCDVSPTNLLVTEDGFLKIIDFGIARANGQRQREEGTIPGKLSYMSPEQASRAPMDHRSDIFSLGVVLYEITVGRRLFKGPAHEVVKKLTEGAIEPPTFTRHDFPGALEGIIMRALERHPENRYQSAYDLADDLEGFLREARLTSGPVRIARYLDELAEAAGGARRPELISERDKQKAAGEEDLEFDEQWSDGVRAADESEWSEWDEYNEPEAEVAAALGLELEQLRLMRTPVPHRDGDVIRLPLPAPVADSSPTAVASESDESVPVIVSPPMTPSGVYPMPQTQTQPVPVAAPPQVVQVVPPPAAHSNFLPWLVLGVCAGIAIGILFSQLL
ncbi:MAG TPA: serine/threonine-protein kinase, partial [Kofleriaceae bacterium]|nr:serine/threonine-protein kinase [Kofleriaceae bacterium]